MNDCPNGAVRDLLPDYLHDRLDANDRTEVEAHLRSCADCRTELALLAELRGALRRAPAVDVSAIAAAIPPYRRVGRRWSANWRIAASITLLVAGGASVALIQRAAPPAPARSARPELAVGTAVVSDLSDRELATLINQIETLDAVPSTEVDNPVAVSPVAPARKAS
jgi:anti-sigma factor RsiW